MRALLVVIHRIEVLFSCFINLRLCAVLSLSASSVLCLLCRDSFELILANYCTSKIRGQAWSLFFSMLNSESSTRTELL